MNPDEKTLLVVDDEVGIRSALFNLLEDLGYYVITAGDGREALDKLEHVKVDLVITDILMPEMDGLELINHLKKRNPEIRCLAFSGGDPTYLKVGEYMGADRVLGKPFSNDELQDIIVELLT
ncbi:response regulator [bacterium]|nr:response regulator [bacterium]